MGLAYFVGYRRLQDRRRAPGTPRAGVLAFASGYGILVLALLSPLHTLGEELFSLHMLQHVLLMLVGAPLLLLSGSMPVMLWALPARDRATIGRLVHSGSPVRRALRFLTHPAVAWGLFVGGQWLWHQPAAYQLAAQDRLAHYAEHLTFFGTALLFWWPVIGAAPLRTPLSYPMRMLYTVSAWIPNSVLGAGLTFAPAVLYPYYAERAQAWGINPLQDQQIAGLIMWMPGDILFLSILLLVLIAFVRAEERAAERIDRELDAREAALNPTHHAA